MDTITTRRALLTAAAVMPALIVAPAIAVASPVDDAVWLRALAAAQIAEEQLDAAFDTSSGAEDAIMEAGRVLAPACIIEHRFAPSYSQLHTLSLDEVASLYEPPHVDGPHGGGAAIAEQVRIYREQVEALKFEHRVAELKECSREKAQVWHAAMADAFATPAPSVRALAEKIALLLHYDSDEDIITSVLADARRLAKMES